MDTKQRCQSCGMPLGSGFFGTQADGSESQEYCKFCFQKGAFVEPDLTLEAMIERSVNHMTTTMHFDEAKARQMANETIPFLGRWKAR